VVILRSGRFTPPSGTFDVRIHRENRDVCEPAMRDGKTDAKEPCLEGC
jgi:hypothetical protein